MCIQYNHTQCLSKNFEHFINVDWEGVMEVDATGVESDYYPFPSKMFALLYILLHSPRPLVCVTL